jgi:hypothetical protein
MHPTHPFCANASFPRRVGKIQVLVGFASQAGSAAQYTDFHGTHFLSAAVEHLVPALAPLASPADDTSLPSMLHRTLTAFEAVHRSVLLSNRVLAQEPDVWYVKDVGVDPLHWRQLRPLTGMLHRSTSA